MTVAPASPSPPAAAFAAPPEGDGGEGAPGVSSSPAATPAGDRTTPRWTLQLPRGRRLGLGERPLVMGVVNLTPDSFSDGGGLWSAGRLDVERAVRHGQELLAEGADLLDLGAESTRPAGSTYGAGAAPVSAQEEIDRLLPVLERLRAETDLPLSVDTRKGEVARAALAAGADLLNDVGALADPELAAIAAAAGCPVVLMHSRGVIGADLAPEEIRRRATYRDVAGEVRDELQAALGAAEAAGVLREQIVLDPGIGFAKAGEQNLALLRRLDVLAALGRPLLVGASRKSFIAHTVAALGGVAPPPARRLPGSLAATSWAAAQGTAIVRVHDVAATVQFLATWSAIAGAATEGPRPR